MNNVSRLAVLPAERACVFKIKGIIPLAEGLMGWMGDAHLAQTLVEPFVYPTLVTALEYQCCTKLYRTHLTCHGYSCISSKVNDSSRLLWWGIWHAALAGSWSIDHTGKAKMRESVFQFQELRYNCWTPFEVKKPYSFCWFQAWIY